MAFLTNDAVGGIELVMPGTDPVYDDIDKKFGSSSASLGGAGYFRSSAQVTWSFPSSFTFHWWMKPSNSTASYTLFAHHTFNVGRVWDTIFNQGRIQFRKAGGASIVLWNTTISTTAWHHMAVVKSGSTWRLFVDGDLKHTNTDTWTPSGTYYMNFGNSNSGSEYYTGRLDAVCWQNQALWSTNFTPPTNPPIADGNTRMIFQFDEVFFGVTGTLTDAARIIVTDEATRTVENDTVKNAGSYSISTADNNVKTMTAIRESDGKGIAYGRVIPSAV
jgi:hypothetical protein